MTRQLPRVAALACVTLGLAATAWAQAPAPKLTVSHSSIDYGDVWHGEHPVVEMYLKNEGNADLVFTRVKVC